MEKNLKNSWEADLALARNIAEQAGELIKSRWGSELKVEHKGIVDLVSEVDLAAEALILKLLHEARSEDAILAEEDTGEDLEKKESLLCRDSGRVWCIDPLDGTTNFSHGLPHFCVSIALLNDGEPQVGVIHDPIRFWTFYASKGHGAWLNGKRLQVNEPRTLEKALIATGFPYDRHTSDHDNLNQTKVILKRCQGLRRAGSAALDLAYVAAGWLDAYWEYKLKPWDIAAGTLILQEAGGIISDINGSNDWLNNGSLVSASHLDLQQELLTLLEDVS